MSSRQRRFEKGRQLGAGSIGPIFEARDHHLDRAVAIRELSQSLVDDPPLARRLLERMEKMAAISHPHVMTVHAVEPRHQPPRFIVELLAGKTVADLLAEGPMSPERVALLFGQGLEGTQQLHHHGIIHGDLRPSQLFVHRNALKVGDFGLTAFRSGEERRSESLRYSAPEVLAEDARLLPASDLFTLGLVAYELTLGTERFLRVVVDHLESMKLQTSSSDSDKLWHGLHTSPSELPSLREVDPSIPKRFSDTVVHLLHKDPADRPESCRRALRELAALRGWTSMFQVVRQPGAKHEETDDPFDDLLRRLSPQRAMIALAVLIAVAIAVSLARRDTGSINNSDAVRPPDTESGLPTAEDLVETPAELRARFSALAPHQSAASIRLSGGRRTLEIGDPLSFEVTSPRGAYAALFVVSVDGTVICLYPNRKQLHLRLEAGVTSTLPRVEDHLLGIALKADLPLGEDFAFLLTSNDVLIQPPSGQAIVGEWILAFPFVNGSDNPAVGFLDWVERRLENPQIEVAQLRYEIRPNS